MKLPEIPEFIREPDPGRYNSDNYLVLDFETTNLDHGDPRNPDNRIIVGVFKAQGKIIVSWLGELLPKKIVQLVESANFIVAHNAKFELGWLARCGIDTSKLLVFDTMLAEYVWSGNRGHRLDLDSCLDRWGMGSKDNEVSTLIKGGVCPSQISKPKLRKYCIQDVQQTEKLFLRQREAYKHLLPVIYTRCIFTPPLQDIETKGICLDCERVEETYNEYKAISERLSKELDEITGGINTGSPKQLAEFLYERLGFAEPKDWRGNPIRTATGQPSTSANVIASLKGSNKSQRRFLEIYKEKNKVDAALSKNLDFFIGVCREFNPPVFYANINQSVTKTHRTSSTGKSIKFKLFTKAKSVQFQNMPRIFKRLVCARKRGWKVGERDGAQLEFRTAAYLGADEAARQAIREGFDVHRRTSDVLTANGQPTDRQDAKSHTFKPLYGGESGTDAERAYYADFKERYPGIAAAQQRWKETVLATKKLVTITGLIFYWPDTRMTRSGYITNSTKICNYPVQSFATADIIPIAVTYLWHYMKAAKLRSFIFNTVHDSALTEDHPDEVEIVKEFADRAFTQDVYNYLKKVFGIDFNVPLEVEHKVGSHWGEAE